MIQINKKKFPKKTIIVVSSIVVLFAASATYVYAFNGNIFGWSSQQGPSNTGNYKPTTPEQQQSGTDIKDGAVNSEDDPAKPSTNTDTPAIPVNQGSDKSSVTLDISSQNQTSSTYQIRTLIGAVTNTGECTLTLTRNGSTISKTASVSALAKTSTCQGFDIPLTELTAGVWQLNIVFSNSTLTGAVTTNITIR